MRRRRPFLLALALGCWALVLFSATSALAADVPILRLAGPAQTLTPTALSAFPPAAHPVSDLKSEISDTLPDSSPRRSAPLEFCIAPLAALPP